MGLAFKAAVTLLAAIACAGQAAAQGYPSKTIQLITSSTPAGLPDLFARVLADKLSEVNKWTVIVNNKPGAGGIIAAESVKQAAPDGYTLLIADSGLLAINPALNSDLPYDSMKDFTPIVPVVSLATYLTVNAALPIRSVKELIDYAKAHPGMNYGSSRNGSVTHLSMELLISLAGLNLTHIPYKGVAASVPAIASGEVSLLFSGLPSVQSQIDAGKVRLLAVSGTRRLAMRPDVPTVAEAGVPGYDLTTTFGVVGPAGTPRDVIQVLNRAINQVLTIRETREKLSNWGLDPTAGTADQYRDAIRAEKELFDKLVKATGAKAG